MTIQERRVKVIEKILDDAISDEVAMEVGIMVKSSMLMMMGDHPATKDVEKAIAQEKAALANQPKIIEILQRKLDEANALLRGGTTK